MKEKFKVRLTEYMIRRIMLELSLYPYGIIRHILGIYPRIGAFLIWFSHLGVQICLFKQEELKRNNMKTVFVNDRKKGEF